ncbi:MAG: hypothetical protein ACPGR8_17310, partial [Limisphaerales bacterium]
MFGALALCAASGLSFYGLSQKSGSTTITVFCPGPDTNLKGCGENVNEPQVIDHFYSREKLSYVVANGEVISVAKGECHDLDTYCTDYAKHACNRGKESHTAFLVLGSFTVVVA